MSPSLKVSTRTREHSRLTHLSPPQMIDIIETVYRGASKGRGLVVSPRGEPSKGIRHPVRLR